MTHRPANDNPYPPDVTVKAIRGYRERIAPSGIKVIEIDFTADPEKDSAAWRDARLAEVGDAMFRREYLRDWTVASGDAFYPEFSLNGGVDTFVTRVRGLVQGIPVGRGWDFGRRNPAVTWGQKVGERALYLRELMLFGVSTYVTADMVRFLSNEIPESEMMREAQLLYHAMVENGDIAQGPWFPKGTAFQDFSGPEALKTSATVRDGDPNSDYEVLASKKIVLNAIPIAVMDRVKIMRKLLYLPKNRKPNVVIDESCRYLIGALNGGLGYESPTPANPVPTKPRKDGKYDNIHDAATYWAVQVFPLGDERVPGRRVVYDDRVPYEVVEDGTEYIGLYETQGARLRKV